FLLLVLVFLLFFLLAEDGLVASGEFLVLSQTDAHNTHGCYLQVHQTAAALRRPPPARKRCQKPLLRMYESGRGCNQEVGGDFVVTAVPENLGKSGSLKKNYGGVSIQKRRRQIKPLDE